MWLHDPGDGADHRGAEVEAESVASVVCSVAGLASDGCSIAYVAGWAGGDRTTRCART